MLSYGGSPARQETTRNLLDDASGARGGRVLYSGHHLSGRTTSADKQPLLAIATTNALLTSFWITLGPPLALGHLVDLGHERIAFMKGALVIPNPLR